MAATEQSKLLGGLLAILMIPAAIIFAGIGVFFAIVIAAGLMVFLTITLQVMKWKARRAGTYGEERTTYHEGETIEGEAVVIEQHEVKKETL